MAQTDLSELLENLDESEEVWIEEAKIEFTEALVKAMEEENLKRKDLADLLGTSKAYISKLLNGNSNPTIETIGKLGFCVGKKVHFYLSHPEAQVNIQEIFAPKTGNTSNLSNTLDLVSYNSERRIEGDWFINSTSSENCIDWYGEVGNG